MLTPGHVTWVALSHIGQVWGKTLVGWGSTLDGVTLPLNSAPPRPIVLPTVSLENLRVSIIRDGPAAQGYASNKANTLPVEQALYDLGYRGFAVDGSAGSATFGPNSAYQRWQVRLGFTGASADGYPPTVLTADCSLVRLALATRRFRAVA